MMDSAERLAVMEAMTEGMTDNAEWERMVRGFVGGCCFAAPILLVKEMARLIIEHQKRYLFGEQDADGLPIY